MDTSILRIRRTGLGHYASHLVAVLVALTAGPGMLHASNLLGTYASSGSSTLMTTVTLNCVTTGSTSPTATIVVKPLASLSANLFITAALSGANAANFTISAPAIVQLGNTASGTVATSLTYTVNLTTTEQIGCQGLANTAATSTATVTFSHALTSGGSATADAAVGIGSTVNSGTLSSTASALTTSLATVNVTCQLVNGTYYPGPAVTVTVGSNASGGTPFGLDAGAPDNLVTYPTAIPGSSVATAGTQVTFTVKAVAGCGGNPVSVTPVTSTISLQSTLLGTNVLVADKTIAVSMVVSGPSASALTVSLATINLTCTLSSGVGYPGTQYTQSVGAASATPFTVDTTVDGAIPSWLNLNGGTSPAGTPTGGSPVTFTVQVINTNGNQCGGKSVQSTPYTYTVYLASTGLPQSDQSFVVNLTVSGPGASPLVVIPSPITVTCAKISNGLGGYNYVPNYPQTVSVTAPSATTFSIGTSAPTWLYIGTLSSTTASTSAATFTLQAQGTAQSTNCNGGVGTSIAIHLVNAPNNDAVFSVVLQIVTPTVLTAAPTSATFTYVKGSGTAGFADIAITSSVLNAYFSINSASLPSWLRSNPSSGSAPQSIRFSSTNVADTLAPGTYTASVVLSVSGYGDLTIPVSMLLTNKAAQMTIQGPTTVNLTWTIGEAYPTPTITVLSTDTPIAYVATTGGSLGPVIATGEQSGLAYSFGTPIGVSFSPQAFASATPGSVLTGTVTLTWGTPASTIVVTFDVSVQSPGATITSLSPSSEAFGQTTFTVALTGTGFVQGVSATQATRVGIVTTAGAAMTFDTAINPTIINGSNMSLQFIYPGAGYAGHIPFTSALATSLGTNSVVIGVCNPVGGVPCQVATASQTLYFGGSPIVQAVTSSSSLLQAGGTPTVAPYDMISIFGANFCPYCATSGSNSVLTGAPDPLTMTYPASLTFTPTTAQTLLSPPVVAGVLTVTFQQHSGGTSFTTTNAPLLFATNGQINLMVPSVVPIASLVDLVVSYTPAGGSAQSSAIYTVSIAATDPGIFTVGADGQGSGAILDLNNNLISATNPAGLRSTTVTGNSDIVTIYMTGLGKPDSTASNASPASDGAGGTGGLIWSADCVTTASYLTSFNAQQTGTAISSLDGTLIVTGPLNTGRLVPCLLTNGTDAVSVTVGNQAVTDYLYAGWVPDTIAGLYQVSFRLPDNIANGFTIESGALLQSITAPTQVPISVTSNTKTTQAGVSIWVAPRLLMAGPTNGVTPNTMSVTVGTALPGTGGYSTLNAVVATGGPNGSTNANYTYAVTSGLLPAGLSIIPSGLYGGLIVGTPAANTGTPGSNAYTVTVTATDQEAIPVTGSITFVVTVGQGLFMTNTTLNASVFGTANNSTPYVTIVAASGGTGPYNYFLPNGYTTATGIAINQTSGAVTTSATTPAGSYPLVVTAIDSTTGTAITGTSNFTIVVNLDEVVAATATTFHAGVTTGAANTITVTGQGGGVLSYTLDAATQALVNSGQLTFANGIVSVTANAGIITQTVTITVTSNAIPFVGTANAGSAGGTASQSFTLTIGS